MTASAAIGPREIAPGVFWVGGCFALLGGGGMHYHVSAYLVRGSKRTALIDTGDPAHWSTLAAQLDQLLGGGELDIIVPTHPELPHAGNLPDLVARYPEVMICGDVRDYHLHYPETESRLRPMQPGERIDLGDREIELLPALIHDLPNTLWAFDTGGRVLFVSDGFAYIHEPGEVSADGEPLHRPGHCQLVSDELPSGPTVQQAAYGTGRSLYWTRFVDISETFAELESLLERLAPQYLAPCHGNVISDPERVIPISIAAHRLVYQGGA